MAVFLSPVGGVAAQFFDNNGIILSGGKIYTYAAGTTTPQATYTSSAGTTPHANPIILNSAGRVPGGEIWLSDSISYKFVIETSASVLLNTYDNVIGVNSGILSALAAPSGSSLVGFVQPSGTARTVQSKLRDTVSVLDFGADPTGVGNSTSAFDAAIATGKRVFVPAGIYSVADIAVVSSICVEGESPLNSSSILEVRTNNSGAFTHSANSFVFDIAISNLTIRAASGVTGAKAYKQIDKSTYSAYVIFQGLETWGDLQIAFDGFFIFARWENCRDGYYGTAPGAQTHQAISSNPATFGQPNQSNINQITNCQFFRSSDPNGCVDLSYGDRWDIRGTDFEALSTQALRVRGIFGLHITGCWFESVNATSVITVGDSPAPNPQGVRLLEIDNCFCLPHPSTLSFVGGSRAGSGSYRNIGFTQAPTNMVFTPATEVNQLINIVVLSGSPTAFTTNTRQVYLGIIRSSTLENTVVSSPSMQNINVLPIGPSGLGVANLSDNYLGIVDPNPTNVASGLGLATTAVEYTLGTDSQWVWYSFNAKMVNFLRGKTITVVINGYGVDALVAEGVSASIWDSVTPTQSNASASATVPFQINVVNTELQISYVTYTVGAAASSLHVGWLNGGANSTKKMIIETMGVYLGTYVPTLGNLR